MSSNQRGVNACIANLRGTGIGSFNDRFRDHALGGGPFADPRVQGWLTGLSALPRDDLDQGSEAQQREALLAAQDSLRLAVAG